MVTWLLRSSTDINSHMNSDFRQTIPSDPQYPKAHHLRLQRTELRTLGILQYPQSEPDFREGISHNLHLLLVGTTMS